MTRRDDYERDLRALLRREGVEPREKDIQEVVDFFAQHGSASLPLLRRAGAELVRAHRQAGNHARPTTSAEDEAPTG